MAADAGDTERVAAMVLDKYGPLYSKAVVRSVQHCVPQGEVLRGGWPIISLNEFGVEQERILLVTNLALYRVKFDFKKTCITRFRRLAITDVVTCYHVRSLLYPSSAICTS